MTEHEYAPNLDHVLEDIEAGRNYTQWIVDRARPFIRGRVLDAGAGTGTFTEAVAQIADEVVALEPERRFVEYLNIRFADNANVHVEEGDLEALPERLGLFDAIVCFNVLEHVRNDRVALRAMHGRLEASGRLLLLVPAHPSLVSPFDRAVGHARRYTRGTLASALDDAGFTIDEVRYVNPIGALAWFVRMRLLRQREWPSTTFHVFDRLVPFLRPFDMLRPPLGLSVWAVARR